MAKKVPMKLKYLRVNPKTVTKTAAPCVEELNALMACWRLNGVDSKGCADMVKALSRCSSKATAAPKAQLQPSINFLLNRMMNLR